MADTRKRSDTNFEVGSERKRRGTKELLIGSDGSERKRRGTKEDLDAERRGSERKTPWAAVNQARKLAARPAPLPAIPHKVERKHTHKRQSMLARVTMANEFHFEINSSLVEIETRQQRD